MIIITLFLAINILNIVNCDDNAFVGQDNFKRVTKTITKETISLNITKEKFSGNSTYDAREYCHQFKSCSDCIQRPFRCVWCHDYGCTDKIYHLCPKTRYAEITNKHPNESCPFIQHDNGILIPSGVRVNLKVGIFSPDPVLYDKEIICQIQLNDRLTHLKGLILGDVVYCYPITLDTGNQNQVVSGTFRLIWGGAQPFSNKISINVYKCETLAIDCESCRVLASEYGCGWCNGVQRCVIADKCSDDFVKWTLNRVTCDIHYRKLIYVRQTW